MENNLSIVTMTKEHVLDVYNIEQELISVPWSLKLLEDLVNQDNVIAKVLLLNNKVIGYYSFYNICGEANINNIAVKSFYHGLGFGNKLMQDIMEECEKNNILDITLEVAADNRIALSLYKKFGFVTEGVRRGYYNNKVDALIMWKRN